MFWFMFFFMNLCQYIFLLYQIKYEMLRVFQFIALKNIYLLVSHYIKTCHQDFLSLLSNFFH